MLRKGVFFCESFIPRADAFTKTGKASKVLGNGIVESGLKHLDNVADGIKKLVKKADDAIDLEKHLPKKLLKEEAEAFAKKADKVADDVVEDAAKAIKTSYGKSSSNGTELVPYYPANNGAVPGTEKKIYLMAGDKIDRFGGKKGKFFSPTGTPMEMRALPYDADLSQYRQFEVVKPFEVEASTIAPAFGNIGLGTQYRSSVSVDVLLKKGIIKQVGGN